MGPTAGLGTAFGATRAGLLGGPAALVDIAVCVALVEGYWWAEVAVWSMAAECSSPVRCRASPEKANGERDQRVWGVRSEEAGINVVVMYMRTTQRPDQRDFVDEDEDGDRGVSRARGQGIKNNIQGSRGRPGNGKREQGKVQNSSHNTHTVYRTSRLSLLFEPEEGGNGGGLISWLIDGRLWAINH